MAKDKPKGTPKDELAERRGQPPQDKSKAKDHYEKLAKKVTEEGKDEKG